MYLPLEQEPSDTPSDDDARPTRTRTEEDLEIALHAAEANHASLNAELQEALDALGTLEQALMESQDERERLLSDISDLKKLTKKPSNMERALQVDLAKIQKEKQVLVAEVAALKQQLSEHASSGIAASEVLIRTSSSTSDFETYLDASNGPPMPPPNQPLPPIPSIASPILSHPPAKHSSVIALMTSGGSSRAPPTPPPSMPPPPLPTERRSSVVSSNTRRDSHTPSEVVVSPAMPQRSESISGDTIISIDARVHAKLEDQEATIARLNKQLHHCEVELRANIDLVTSLEAAMNEQERTMRKNRINMTDLARERDLYMQQCMTLRQQVNDAQQQVDTARTSLVSLQEESKQRADTQRRVQAEAQRTAELRMAEMQKLNRRSKFNVSLNRRSFASLILKIGLYSVFEGAGRSIPHLLSRNAGLIGSINFAPQLISCLYLG